MWTKGNRRRYDRSDLHYESDLTDGEWAEIAPLILPAKPGGNKRSVNLREVVNGLMYILGTGCQWRAIPKDLAARSTIYDYFDRWHWDGTLEHIHHALYVKCREQASREAIRPWRLSMHRASRVRKKAVPTSIRMAEDYAHALPRRPKMRGAGHPSPAYVAEEVSQLRLALAAIIADGMPVRDLTADDVRRLLDKVGGGNTRARFGALSRFLDWCQDTGHIEPMFAP